MARHYVKLNELPFPLDPDQEIWIEIHVISKLSAQVYLVTDNWDHIQLHSPAPLEPDTSYALSQPYHESGHLSGHLSYEMGHVIPHIGQRPPKRRQKAQ
jgi:hypothetical protein